MSALRLGNGMNSMTTGNFYAGIGSRDTPPDILEQMTEIASMLSDKGYILRSGHADGADLAFERGSKGQNQIWLPWPGFNYNSSQAQGLVRAGHYVPPTYGDGERIAKEFHPNWKACSAGAKKLHIRNVYQVLGPELGFDDRKTLSKFVVCWTKDGKASGGTGQAIRIAEAYKVPVFNIFNSNQFLDLMQSIYKN